MTLIAPHKRNRVKLKNWGCRGKVALWPVYFGIVDLHKERKTKMEYTAVIKRSGEWWIGRIEEVPGVNCQEPTREELRRSLAETLSEALGFNRQDALAAAGDDYYEEKVAIA